MITNVAVYIMAKSTGCLYSDLFHNMSQIDYFRFSFIFCKYISSAQIGALRKYNLSMKMIKHD